ncbi:fimbrial protein [Intestinirhabdus alba]|jgi:type 1 fimbria pilin|uniref:Fimbrial protein n=1 Tax=Intestinirhabdus alba TaxID=2899544 RepID=A0A6L6ILV8_9ENTR|nr:fimbrial protein [Intestinirhabdus alba]MTH47821.1 fimbrial protein [Intestinirhabdus alba]
MRNFLLAALLLAVSGLSYATCHSGQIRYASPLTVDLSDKLTPATPTWTGSFYTQYTGSFFCTTWDSEFGYTRILNTDDQHATILSFHNGKYNVRAEIINNIANKKLASYGNHTASELNVPITVRFTLVPTSGAVVAGDTITLKDVLFVTDLSGMSLGEILIWPLAQLIKILQWLTNGFQWPYDSRDMFGQPMIVTYTPKLTTCSFSNAGLSVVLPTLGKSQVLSSDRPGFTPFTLNMRCSGIAANGTADRAIDMFLSSTSLLATDATVMTDGAAGAAKGVGLRLVRRDGRDTPIVLSSSSASKGNATSLFYVASGGPLEAQFTIPVGVYYYAWSPTLLSQGKINTTATLNIIYP